MKKKSGSKLKKARPKRECPEFVVAVITARAKKPMYFCIDPKKVKIFMKECRSHGADCYLYQSVDG